MKRTKLTLKSVGEISLVDRGDNPEAHVMIHKRAGAPDPTAPVTPAVQPHRAGGGVLKAIIAGIASLLGKSPEEVAKATDEATTFAEMSQGRRMQDAINEVWDFGWQWYDSVGSILRDPSISEEERASLLSLTHTQFYTAVQAASATWLAGETTDGIVKSGRKMSADRVARLRAASEQLSGLLAEVDDTTTTTSEESVAASTTEVDKSKQAPPSGTPQATPLDELLKSADPALAAFVKSQQDAVAKAQADAAAALKRAEEADEARAVADLTKRLAAGGDLHGLPGMTVEKLRATQVKLGDDWAAHEETLKASAEAIRTGSLFRELGSGGDTDAGDAMGALKAKAAEIRAAEPTLTEPQAIAKAAAAHKDLAAAARASIRGEA